MLMYKAYPVAEFEAIMKREGTNFIPDLIENGYESDIQDLIFVHDSGEPFDLRDLLLAKKQPRTAYACGTPLCLYTYCLAVFRYDMCSDNPQLYVLAEQWADC